MLVEDILSSNRYCNLKKRALANVCSEKYANNLEAFASGLVYISAIVDGGLSLFK